MTKLNVVYQCCDLPGSEQQMSEQIKRLIDSGLANRATVYISMNGNITKFLSLAQQLEHQPNFRLCHTSDRSDLMEYPALMLLKELADKTSEEEYMMYFHLKGITHQNHRGIHDWRRYMEYWTIDRWQENVAALDQGYDTCGTNYIHIPFMGADLKTRDWQHYSGGFWWARSSYVKRLKPLVHPDNYVMGTVSEYTGYTIDKNLYRFDHEAWIASGKPHWAEISSTPGGSRGYPGWHYHHEYPAEFYQKHVHVALDFNKV
jgi:hypothetical protein